MESPEPSPVEAMDQASGSIRRTSSAFGNLALPNRRKSGTFSSPQLPADAPSVSTVTADAATIKTLSPGDAKNVESKDTEEPTPVIRRASILSALAASARRDSVSNNPPSPAVPDGEEEGDFARQLRMRTAERKSKLKTRPSLPPAPAVATDPSATSDSTPKAVAAPVEERRPSIKPSLNETRRPSAGETVGPVLPLSPESARSAIGSPRRHSGGPVPVSPDANGITPRLSIVDGFAVRRKSAVEVPVSPPSLDVKSNEAETTDGSANKAAVVVEKPSVSPTTVVASSTLVVGASPERVDKPSPNDPKTTESSQSTSTPSPQQPDPSPTTTTTTTKPKRRGSMTKVQGFKSIPIEEKLNQRRALAAASTTRPALAVGMPPLAPVVTSPGGPENELGDTKQPRRPSLNVNKEVETEAETSALIVEITTPLITRRSSSSTPQSPNDQPDSKSANVDSPKPLRRSSAPDPQSIEPTPHQVERPASPSSSPRRHSLGNDDPFPLPAQRRGSSDALSPPSSRRTSLESPTPLTPPARRSSSAPEPSPASRRSSLTSGTTPATIADRATMIDAASPVVISSPSPRRTSSSSNIAVGEAASSPLELPSSSSLSHPRSSQTTFSLESSPSSSSRRASLETGSTRPSLFGFVAGRRRESSMSAGDSPTVAVVATRGEEEKTSEETEGTEDDSMAPTTRPHLQSAYSVATSEATRRLSTVSSMTTKTTPDETSPSSRRSSLSLLGATMVTRPKRAAGEEDDSDGQQQDREEEENGDDDEAMSSRHRRSSSSSSMSQRPSSLPGPRSSSSSNTPTNFGAADSATAEGPTRRDSSAGTNPSPSKKRLSILGGLASITRKPSITDSPKMTADSPSTTMADEYKAFFPELDSSSPLADEGSDFVMEITDEEKRSFEATQARKDSQALLKQLQMMTAKTTELASFEAELRKIQQERGQARQSTKRTLEINLQEQDDIERQIQALRQRKKNLQVEAANLDEVLAEQERAEKLAGEDRDLALFALEQAEREKQEVIAKYQELHERFPDKIRPVNGGYEEDTSLPQTRSRRLTFPLPVHAPSPAPPLVLRGLFQLKKDPSIDKIAGPNRVSSSTRQVLFSASPSKPPLSVPKTSPQRKDEPFSSPSSAAAISVSAGSPQQLPIPPPRRPSLLNALQNGVSLKKVSETDKRRSLSRDKTSSSADGDEDVPSGGASVVMSRLVKQMNARREVIKDEPTQEEGVNNDVTEEEWE